ncbi:hypothetical protein ABGB17_03185 [Sphaerisporangium sp. B11E5]|uniref:hypothetical protein n=1 Tax=Sphaerisporangium sp. B11E5 TaxID=3153563 RepID=UPI00325D50DA
MREAFAHEAVAVLSPGGDERALGAAVTVALCGHWEHPPPCPLAPHHCHTDRDADEVRLRVLFAAEPRDEPEVRRRIDNALASGAQTGPDGAVTRWRLRGSGPAAITPGETEHAGRLIAT